MPVPIGVLPGRRAGSECGSMVVAPGAGRGLQVSGIPPLRGARVSRPPLWFSLLGVVVQDIGIFVVAGATCGRE